MVHKFNNNNNSRQANYKRRGGGGSSQFMRSNNIKRLLDDDIVMDGANHAGGSNKYRNGGRPGGNFRRDKVPVLGDSKWYKVEARVSKDVSKDVLLNAIRSSLDGPFQPVKFRAHGKMMIFNVSDYKLAKSLRDLSGRITLHDGEKVTLNVESCGRPSSQLTKEVLDKIKEVMSKRFVAASNFLDLSNFCEDSDLIQNDVFVNFGNRKLAEAVVDIIGEHIPELKSLDLSQNALATIHSFSGLVSKASKITALNLCNNQIKIGRELQILKKLKLEEISLRGNPMLKNFRDGQAYIRSMRQQFPTLLKLDQEVLPPPIKFSIGTCELPASQGSHFGQENIQGSVCLFLQQYFSIYDTKDKSPLVNAYHENATYSLSCCNVKLPGQRDNIPGVGAYVSLSRNILKISYDETFSRLKTKRNEIINFLKNMPETVHEPESFLVDVSYISATMIVFNVKGVFREVSSSHSNQTIFRHFNRVIVAVPNGSGLAIMNEMVNVSSLSSEQYAKYMESQKAKQKAPEAPRVVAPEPAVSPQQSEMIALFSQQSGMNTQFSALCLAENEWNYEKAAAKFTELQQVGGIPPEAFVK